MKWFFYIFGILLGLFIPAEYLCVSIYLILIGVIFHITDIKERIDTMEINLQKDHRYIKNDIKDLEIKK